MKISAKQKENQCAEEVQSKKGFTFTLGKGVGVYWVLKEEVWFGQAEAAEGSAGAKSQRHYVSEDPGRLQELANVFSTPNLFVIQGKLGWLTDMAIPKKLRVFLSCSDLRRWELEMSAAREARRSYEPRGHRLIMKLSLQATSMKVHQLKFLHVNVKRKK